MERLGYGPEALQAANPRLVFGRVTGWGQDGPLAAQVGHDLNYIGLSGVLHAMGPADRPPAPPCTIQSGMCGTIIDSTPIASVWIHASCVCSMRPTRRGGSGVAVDR